LGDWGVGWGHNMGNHLITRFDIGKSFLKYLKKYWSRKFPYRMQIEVYEKYMYLSNMQVRTRKWGLNACIGKIFEYGQS
jgi:hypothetical protein